MKINFIVPALKLNGGTRVIAMYAGLLAKRGHTVTVVSPGENVPTYWQQFKNIIKSRSWIRARVFSTEFFSETDINLKILDSFRPVVETDVPDGDILIATFWTTAEWISSFSTKKGSKFYFIQGYEIFPGFSIERLEATFKMPYKKIVISKWLYDVIKKHKCNDSVSIVPNGVDIKQFYANEREKNTKPTIGLVYNVSKIKGCDIAFKSLDIARKVLPNIKLIAFGHYKPTKKLLLPINTEYYFQPNQNEIKNIYAKCDVWLFPSRSEGFGLPILEAMACRTPVIGTTTGAAPEILACGAGILVDIDDAKMMANAIIHIAQMNNYEWKLLSDKAYEVAIGYSWDKSVALFEQALQLDV